MDRTVIVTGAASGIGLAVCEQLVRDGRHRVAMVDISSEVTRCAQQLGERARGYIADVASEQEWQETVTRVRGELGSVDDLVLNALATDIAPIHEMSPESWQRQLDVNLTGAFHGVRNCLADMRRKDDGRIVIVSSVHAAFGLPDVPAYAATKAGLTGLTRQLAVQYADSIRANCVVPGPILTAQWERFTDAEKRQSADETVMGRLGKPEEVASAITFLLGEGASYMTGSTLTVDGGWSITKNSS